MIDRESVIDGIRIKKDNGIMMANWIRQQIEIRHVPKSNGCILAIAEFGNHNPFSDRMIYNLKELEEFKNIKYQSIVSHKKPVEKTKNRILKEISRHKKEVLLAIEEVLDNPSDPLNQALVSMSRRF